MKTTKSTHVAGVKRPPRRPHKPKTAGSTPACDPPKPLGVEYDAKNVLAFPWHTSAKATAQPTWDCIGALATLRLVHDLKDVQAGLQRERTWIHATLADAVATMKECRALLGGLQRKKKRR